jgi:hypothetical protein
MNTFLKHDNAVITTQPSDICESSIMMKTYIHSEKEHRKSTSYNFPLLGLPVRPLGPVNTAFVRASIFLLHNLIYTAYSSITCFLIAPPTLHYDLNQLTARVLSFLPFTLPLHERTSVPLIPVSPDFPRTSIGSLGANHTVIQNDPFMGHSPLLRVLDPSYLTTPKMETPRSSETLVMNY